MGKKLDALLGRNFKTPKLKTLANLAISRISMLKKRRHVRCSHSQSDVIQLLKLGQQESALLRVEHVIKEQNMVDVYVMIENYCYLLIERIVLFINNRECPEELKETISSLIFAASRCGEFPELQQLREIFTSRFGKEFGARAIESRNNYCVNPKMVQNLSAGNASLESRLKVLKQIAFENGITLHFDDDDASEIIKEKQDVNQKQEQLEAEDASKLYDPEVGAVSNDLHQELTWGGNLSESMKGRKKYRDVAAAAQDAFESAAYAAAAARAAVELSRSDSRDEDSDDHCSSNHRPGRVLQSNWSSQFKLQIDGHVALEDVKHQDKRLGSDKSIHYIERFTSESEDEEMAENSNRSHLKSLNLYDQNEEIAFDGSDDENGKNDQHNIPKLNHHGMSTYRKSNFSHQ